jgi:hypothetical protein
MLPPLDLITIETLHISLLLLTLEQYIKTRSGRPTLSLTSALDVVDSQNPRPSCFTPWGDAVPIL